jgi:hypothetical protein
MGRQGAKIEAGRAFGFLPTMTKATGPVWPCGVVLWPAMRAGGEASEASTAADGPSQIV